MDQPVNLDRHVIIKASDSNISNHLVEKKINKLLSPLISNGHLILPVDFLCDLT